jgi:hypothetical protein
MEDRWVGRMEDRWVGRMEDRWVGRMENHWVGRMEDRWVDRMEDRWVGRWVGRMEDRWADRMEDRWVGRWVGRMELVLLVHRQMLMAEVNPLMLRLRLFGLPLEPHHLFELVLFLLQAAVRVRIYLQKLRLAYSLIGYFQLLLVRFLLMFSVSPW